MDIPIPFQHGNETREPPISINLIHSSFVTTHLSLGGVCSRACFKPGPDVGTAWCGSSADAYWVHYHYQDHCHSVYAHHIHNILSYSGYPSILIQHNSVYQYLLPTVYFSPPVDWIPLVRELVAISAFILSLVLTTSLTLLVIAIAWIHYHPLYGLAILAGACAPFIIQRLFPPKQKDG